MNTSHREEKGALPLALATLSFAVCFAAWGLVAAFAPRFHFASQSQCSATPGITRRPGDRGTSFAPLGGLIAVVRHLQIGRRPASGDEQVQILAIEEASHRLEKMNR